MDDDWKTIIEWCLVASQSDNNRKSLLSINVNSVAIDDDEFDTWVESKLDMAGKTPLKELANTGVASPSATPSERAAPHGAPLGFNRRAGYVTIHPGGSGSNNRGGTGTLARGTTPLNKMSKGFDKDHIAKVKDACGVMSAKDIWNIWSIIQATKGKAHGSSCNHLKKSIESSCRSRHIERDKSIYLTAKFFEDLVALRFNPGGPVAQYELAGRGISMLSCRSLMAVEAETQRGYYKEALELTKAETQRGYEEVSKLTKTTRKLEDILKEKGKTPSSAPNYMQLKLNIGTFCALLWTQFGDNCDYYKELVKLHRIQDKEECFTIRDAYTKEICARITWAIIDYQRSFFGRNPVSTDFTPGTPIPVLSSILP